MRSNRPGCLSGTGIAAALIAALVIAGYAYARGGLMFSPGPLNAQGDQTLSGVASHTEIGGECSTCHAAPWEAATMADRCVVCHQDIAAEMQDESSLHGTLMNNEPGLTCRECHPEHRGAEASITVMEDLSVFPHEAVGFSLNGHQLAAAREPFQCDDCHHDDITTFNLDTCAACHRQMDARYMTSHVLVFGTACLDCHDGVDRFDENFDHNVFAFQLTGQHVNVDCAACHINARSLGDFTATPPDCYSCHLQEDAHDGQFGRDCAACHNTAGWQGADFDHNLSNFPLTGAHVDVACESCHVNGLLQELSTDCVACHAEPEFHAGLFGTDCDACHATTAWTPAEFNGPHIFPLNHGGGATCATCHPASFTTYTCYGCHEHEEADIREEHLDEGIRDFENCLACHPSGQEPEDDNRDDND